MIVVSRQAAGCSEQSTAGSRQEAVAEKNPSPLGRGQGEGRSSSTTYCSSFEAVASCQLPVASEGRGASVSLPPAPCPLPSGRSGISLLEVLFAMGVMSVGILSVVLLIPVGVYELAEAQKLDSGSTLGRAAFRDLEVRGYLRPETWVDTQWGMLIDADPTHSNPANYPTYQGRQIAYPYLPQSVLTAYPPPGSAYGGATLPGTPPTVPTQPQQWPEGFSYSYYSQGPQTPPTGLPLGGGPWNGSTPFPPLSASDLPVMILDPLLVGYTGAIALGGLATGPATVPSQGGAPAVWTNIQTFPYQQTYVQNAPLIPRLTVLPNWPLPFVWTSGNALPIAPPIWPQQWAQDAWQNPRFMPFGVADRIFRATDDLQFTAATTQRDRPALLHDSTGMPQYVGGYTWFAMIAPARAEADLKATEFRDASSNPDLTALNSTRQFDVWVIVCNNRILDVPANPAPEPRPGEWMVPVAPIISGLGGGDITVGTSGTAQQQAAQAGWLAGVHPGQWVMLSTIMVSLEVRNNGGNPVNWPRFQTIADWYRVVAVDDGSALSATGGSRYVTLHGADFPPSTALQPAGNPLQPVFATFVEGVVGVYQKTITLDGDSAWGLPP
jgi:hypothetical protein